MNHERFWRVIWHLVLCAPATPRYGGADIACTIHILDYEKMPHFRLHMLLTLQLTSSAVANKYVLVSALVAAGLLQHRGGCRGCAD